MFLLLMQEHVTPPNIPLYSDIQQLIYMQHTPHSLTFFFVTEHLKMLPGATDYGDLYSTQLSKRTPFRVRVNFKRIGEKKS